MDIKFDFTGRDSVEDVMKKTWSDFRDSLKNKEFSYNDIEKAKGTAFLRTYDDLFNNNQGILQLTKALSDIKNDCFIRGAILEPGEIPRYERFMPNKEFIKKDNRFSPLGVEWLYMAMGTETNAIKCSASECRVKKGDNYAYCHFKINEHMYNNRIVDLTIARNYTFDEINEKLQQYLLESINPLNQLDKNEFTKNILEWSVYTYTKMLSEQVFAPLNTNDRSIEYAPFQTLAQYYILLGYSGVIYESTVSKVGKNIVLFDKTAALPYGNIITELA